MEMCVPFSRMHALLTDHSPTVPTAHGLWGQAKFSEVEPGPFATLVSLHLERSRTSGLKLTPFGQLAADVGSTPLPGDEPTESTDLIDMDAVADAVLPDTNHESGEDTAMVDESGRPQCPTDQSDSKAAPEPITRTPEDACVYR